MSKSQKCHRQKARQAVRRVAEEEEERETGNLHEESEKQEFEEKHAGKPRAQYPAKKKVRLEYRVKE